MNKWIRVQDELPPEDYSVLIVDEDSEYNICKMQIAEFCDLPLWTDLHKEIVLVTHWMHIPILKDNFIDSTKD